MLIKSFSHADDEEVCEMWEDISKQYQKYKWQNAKVFKFDLEGYLIKGEFELNFF